MNERPAVARLLAGGAIVAACAAAAASAYAMPLGWRVSLPMTAVLLAYLACARMLQDERRKARALSELHLGTVEALAVAIDAKDQTSPDHIRRVQAYAAGLARALGLPDTDVQAIKTAALLHDIGKLAIPEHILVKPGALTPDELQKVRVHPEVGARILRDVPFPYPVAPLIRGHHERWDGRGYPDGLKEDQIPLGARVLSVADCFDSLTSDRPYHKAVDHSAAVALLQHEAGAALDPRVVDAFVRILPELTATARIAGSTAGPGPPGRTADPPQPAETAPVPRASVFDDIAIANREIYALYQIAQTMGTTLPIADTMALVSSRLLNLVPFSACALFLYSDRTEELHCRFATGTDSELIQQLSVRSGQGMTGWVARNRRPLINAQPGADLQAAGSNAPTLLQSALACPLVVGDRLIGTLALYHVRPGFYNEDHSRLLDRVCEQAAAVLRNAIVFEQTQEDSLTDPLTGLPNARSLFHHLARELARAERLNGEVALLVMDLDAFKEINDGHGHQVGDWALREVGRVLRAAIRPYDMCVRYAGDEFIVVLWGCGRDEAETKRAELQAAVNHIALLVESGRQVPLSISAGAAVFPHDGDNTEALLAQADQRMYRDKGGRRHATPVPAR